ncbi:MAG TPA: prepilin-type N-terminal cleavage/methylation domain-containing protein [bacterium]|nr:prepilin-type N-terminal cleavage/methylation domain-containing protein [bacterium]
MTRQAGLTFIEVLVATFLVGVALVPLVQLYPALLEAEQVVDTDTRVGTVAGRKMEEIINRLRTDITSVTSGAETCTDFPSCWIEWTVATESSSAVVGVGSLVTTMVTACTDGNGNNACDGSDITVRYDAKVTSRP